MGTWCFSNLMESICYIRTFHLVFLGKKLRMESYTNLTRWFPWAVTLGKCCSILLVCYNRFLLTVLMSHASWIWRLKLPRIDGSLVPYKEVNGNRIKSCICGIKNHWHEKHRVLDYSFKESLSFLTLMFLWWTGDKKKPGIFGGNTPSKNGRGVRKKTRKR